MKVLVTGSAGYIGQHLCKMLRQNGHYVVGLDRVNNPSMCDEFIYQDILENKTIAGEYDTVVHLAALVRVGDSEKYPMAYLKTNVVGTINMLANTIYKHFIFASTGAAENPTSTYGTSKLIGEMSVRQYCGLNDKPYTLFRFYNVIGTDGFPPTNPDGLMYNLIKAKYTGEFNLYGFDYNTPDGTAIRDYIHVKDLCQAIVNCVESSQGDTEVQNICTGRGHSVAEIINEFCDVNNCNFILNAKDRRPGDQERTVLSNPSKFFKSTYSLKDMLKI